MRYLTDLPQMPSFRLLDNHLKVSKQFNPSISFVDGPAFRAAERVAQLHANIKFPSWEFPRGVVELQHAVQPLYQLNKALAHIRSLPDLTAIQHSHGLATAAALSSVSLSLPLPNPPLSRHSVWAEEITNKVSKIDFGLVSSAFPTGWAEHLRSAFRDVEFAREILDSISAEALFAELATEVERASAEPEGLGIGAAIAHVLSRLTGIDERQRGYLFIVLLLAVVTVGQESIGGVAEVEYERWRNAPDPSLAHQVDVYDQSRRDLQELAERISHPPMIAHVIRSARLRVMPDTGASVVRTLKPGTHLLVLERRDGWVRVEAEPVPGEVFEGWVYGRLTRYVH